MAPPPEPEHKPRSGPPVPDFSPEARRRAAQLRQADLALGGALPQAQPPRWREIAKRTALGTWNDGFVHAGNLAYNALFAVFPFFILGAAAFSAFGGQSERALAIDAVLRAVPPSVRQVIGPAAHYVIEERSGWLLWAGAVFALWTVGSLIETIRDILRRAYGTRPTRSFWFHRLASTAIIIGAVLLLMVALVAQVTIGAAEEAISAWFPELSDLLDSLAYSRVVPGAAILLSIYLLFLSLTPAAYRNKRYPKWPGAVLVTCWWIAVTIAFPPLLSAMFSYDLTYGSLAGIMITLFFFWLIGLGMVAGAELNAAIALPPEEENAMRAAAKGQEEAAQ